MAVKSSAGANFENVLGSGRGHAGTPWEQMSSTDQRLACAAARRRFIIDVSHYSGGHYAPESEWLRAQLQTAVTYFRSQELYGTRLISAIETWVVSENEVDAALTALAKVLARRAYGQWLDCGHGPTASEIGPVVAIYGENQRRLCQDCAVIHELKIMSEREKMHAYLSSDGNAITTGVGGVLARVTRCWQAGNARSRAFDRRYHRLYWNAVDPTGAHWYGFACEGKGSATVMHRRRVKA